MGGGHELSPATHPGPSGTPRSYHWKSFSNIRSNQLACWLFLCWLLVNDAGPLGTANCDRVHKMLSKTLNLNQTHFNPIICPGFIFPNWKCMHLPLPSLRRHQLLSPRHASPSTGRQHAACTHNVGWTPVLYVGECLLRLCGIRMNALPLLIGTSAFMWNSTCGRLGLALL